MTSLVSAGLGGFMLGRVLPSEVHSINRAARSRFKRRAAAFSAAAFYFASTRTIALTCHSERSVPMYLFPQIVPYDFRSGRAVEESLLAFVVINDAREICYSYPLIQRSLLRLHAQIAPRHLLWLPNPQNPQQRRRDAPQRATLFEPQRAIFLQENKRHRIRGVVSVRTARHRIDHRLGIAVVRSDDPGAAAGPQRLKDAPKTCVHRFHGANRRLQPPRMPDHIGGGKIHDHGIAR